MNAIPQQPGRSSAAVPVGLPSAGVIRNAMTVDVEDYFQVQAFANVIPVDRWDTMPSRVEANMDGVLAQFDRAGVSATFFTLGWVAQRHPAIVRRIVAAGHELASHGYWHQRADRQDKATFLEDVRSARLLLEDTGGVAVTGYRAPTFSINRTNPWAFDALSEAGYRYSSSVFPVRHDLYGVPDAPRHPYVANQAGLLEIPMSTVRLRGRNLPCSGGGYFRLIPYDVFRRGVRHIHRHDKQPAMFYFHPWEVDPGQPRITDAPRLSRFRHYLNLAVMARRIDRLMADFQWDRVDRVFGHLLHA